MEASALHPALVALEALASVLAVHRFLKAFHLGVSRLLMFALLLATFFSTFVLHPVHLAFHSIRNLLTS